MAALLLYALAGEVCQAGARGLPPHDGIGNFGRVNETLYRGAQPDAVALGALQKLGVKMIIDLRMPGKLCAQEAAAARALGLVWTNIAMRGTGRPTDEQVERALSLIESAPGPVFIHCQHGCDRTGMVVACYRIEHDKWTSLAALREARQYGMSRLERGMRRYVAAFENGRGDRKLAEAKQSP